LTFTCHKTCAPHTAPRHRERRPKHAFIEETTGLRNKTGWDASERKTYVASMDIREFRQINDHLMHEGADVLLDVIGQVA